jgi:hypothetical protein
VRMKDLAGLVVGTTANCVSIQWDGRGRRHAAHKSGANKMTIGKTYGYARVSTDGQTLDAQVAALKAAGAEKVFSEKQSGAKTDRAALAKALAALASGDVLVVTGPAREKHQGPPKRAGDGRREGRGSDRWAINGRTPPPRMGD